MGKEERQARKDDAAAAKAAQLHDTFTKVTAKLKDTGHLAAAKNVEAKGGRWDSPEARDEAKGRGGR